MDERARYLLGVTVTAGLFVLIYLIGLSLVTPLVGTEPAPGTDPDDLGIGIFFIVALLVMTGLMLAAFRFGLNWLVRVVVLFVTFVLAWFVLDALFPGIFGIAGVQVLPLLAALVLVVALAVYPEWYVLNVAGIVIGAGAVALLGVTLGIRPAILLLVVLAVYDLISVYGTKHMLTLAAGAMRGNLPVVLIVPLTFPFSIREENDDESIGPDGAVVIGLGDAVIPGMLVTSAAVYGPIEPTIVGPLAISTLVVGAIVGTLLGLVGLFVLTTREKAHPGLPFLSSGAILGYLLGAAIGGVAPLEAISTIVVAGMLFA